MTVLKADQQAADRLLKAATRRAADVLSVVIPHDRRCNGKCTAIPEARAEIIAMLTAAGESAALLLDERPAKKAAARKGAS